MREKANAKFGEPLTLEQLLEMNGKPVWTELLVESTGRKEGWTLIYNDDGYAAVQRWTQSPLWYKDYGKTWLAYAYHPVHIDRDHDPGMHLGKPQTPSPTCLHAQRRQRNALRRRSAREMQR